MKHTHTLIALLTLAATSAFADDPPAAPASTTAQTSTQPAPAAAPSADDIKKAQEAQSHYLRSNGWKPRIQNGVTIYCKTETPIGTNFAKQRCQSGDSAEAELRADKVNQENGPRPSSVH